MHNIAHRRLFRSIFSSCIQSFSTNPGKLPLSPSSIVAPSLLACDLSQMATEAQRMVSKGADQLHIDIMDGHFVPNLTWGPPVLKHLRSHVEIFLDVHVMVTNPEDYVLPLADAGADSFTFHIEATTDPRALIQQIRQAPRDMQIGIAINPTTHVETVLPYAEECDILLVMTVEPGFGGQSFMHDMMPKVTLLRELYPDKHIQVDGGVGLDTIDAAAKAGANMVVGGSSIFGAKNEAEAIDGMRLRLDTLRPNTDGRIQDCTLQGGTCS